MNQVVKRSVFGLIFCGIIVCCLLANQYTFFALSLFSMIIMMTELYKMASIILCWQSILSIFTGLVFSSLTFLCCVADMPAMYISLALFPLFALMASLIFSEINLPVLLLSLVYIALPLSLANIWVFQGGIFDAKIILYFFVIIWCSDSGAYIIGRLFGKNGKKLSPNISPNKSWPGFWGGLFFSILASIVLFFTKCLAMPLYHCVILAMIIHMVGVCGDLFESKLKRQYGVKDSGNLIPGHGGLLDRLDSSLFAMPVGAIYILLVS